MHSFLLKDSIISKDTFLTGKVGPYMESRRDIAIKWYQSHKLRG